jgi:hypothetical protein
MQIRTRMQAAVPPTGNASNLTLRSGKPYFPERYSDKLPSFGIFDTIIVSTEPSAFMFPVNAHMLTEKRFIVTGGIRGYPYGYCFGFGVIYSFNRVDPIFHSIATCSVSFQLLTCAFSLSV